MVVVGIDQSYSSTGIVALDGEDIILARTCGVSTDTEDIFEKAWDVNNQIISAIHNISYDIAVVEGLSFGNMGNVTRNLAGLQFLIVCHLKFVHNAKVIIVPPRTLKKLATGNGGCSKQDMINALPTHVLDFFLKKGYKKSTGLKDLADAYWLCKAKEYK